MKKGGGKAKGSAFEREISKKLSIWMGAKDKDIWVWRSPSSGAVSTIANKYNDFSGDLIATNPIAEKFFRLYSIELKNGYSDAIIDKTLLQNSTIEKFWKQTINDAIKGNKDPILIFKRTRSKTIIGINENTKNKLTKKLKNLNSIVIKFNIIDAIHVYILDEFMYNIKYNDMVE